MVSFQKPPPAYAFGITSYLSLVHSLLSEGEGWGEGDSF